MVALADEAPLPHGEQPGGGVGGLLDDAGQAQQAVAVVFEQAQQGVLHQGQAGRRLQVWAGLLLPGVRGVVGGDDVDAAFIDRLEQRFSILGGLDGRVAL